MLNYDAEQSIGYWVATTAHALRRALEAELADQNMTLRQWEVLAWIAVDGAQSQADLAEKLGIEAPTLAGILSRMERDGWLERYECPDDRRRKRIRATQKAESVWSQASECCKRVREQAALGLTDEDLAQLKRVCAAIRENLGTAESTGSSIAMPCPSAEEAESANQDSATA